MNELIQKYVSKTNSLSFDEQLANDSPIAISLVDSSLPWLICIGGLNQRMGMPVHEFVKVASDVPSNRLFVRDSTRLWYQKGLPLLADSFESAGDVVGAMLDYLEAEHRMVVASSAGGFAAIGWASSLKIKHALVFSPQTTISPLHKLPHDRRWMKFVWKSWIRRKRVLDVALINNFSSDRTVRVIYADRLKADKYQAERLSGIAGVILDPRNSSDHSIVRELRDTGELAELISSGLKSNSSAV